MRYCAKSDIGKKYSNNEDAYVLPRRNKKYKISNINHRKQGSLFILCDGMGGENAGEIASELTANWIFQKYYSQTKNDKPKKLLNEIIIDVNKQIFDLSQQYEEYNDMGTTLVLTLFFNKKVYIDSVGDSRGYLFRDNKLDQVTEDQSEVWDLYKMGAISKEDIRFHPRNNIISKAIGAEKDFKSKDINHYELEQKKDDIYLMCSDGLTDMVGDKEIANILSNKKSLKRKTSQLIDLANKNGGKDNISVILIRV